MQPPAQVVMLVFFRAAALIDLSMVQAKRDPLRAPHLRVRKKHWWANLCLLCGAASPLDEVASQGFNGSAERLCKLHSCTSVRHEVPASCHYEHNHSSKRNLGTLKHSAPLRSLALALVSNVHFVRF